MKNGIDFAKVWNVFSATSIPESGILPVGIELKQSGLKYELKKAWVQISAPNGMCVYVAIQKKVRHVHLSGFGRNADGTFWTGAEATKPNGRVQAQLDFSLPDDLVLKHLEMLLLAMPTLAKEETKRVAPMGASSRPKAPKTPGTQKESKQEEETVSSLAAQEKLQRLILFAAQYNKPISRETFEKWCAAGADPLSVKLPAGYESIRELVEEEEAPAAE
jgi:hypothetical protein